MSNSFVRVMASSLYVGFTLYYRYVIIRIITVCTAKFSCGIYVPSTPPLRKYMSPLFSEWNSPGLNFFLDFFKFAYI